MISVSLHGKGVPSELSSSEMEGEGRSIGDLVQRLLAEKPVLNEYLMAKGKLRTDLTILVNGRHCMFMEGLETRLDKGDKVDILLPMIGG